MSHHRKPDRRPSALFGALSILLTIAAPTQAQTNNACDLAGEYPDVIIADIAARTKWGTVGDITAFSLGVTACNPGSCWANWKVNTADHPAMGQNMFRLEDGRFEQIGQSWAFHAFFALSHTYCSTDCIAADGAHLGVNCSNTDAASYSGSHQRLGPKFEVNPASGDFPFPATGMNLTGDVIYKRLQVHDADLDPSHHPGARYWVEAQFVAHDDAAGENKQNNVSFRPINVTGVESFDIALSGVTVRAKPAIEAWKEVDPNVTLAEASLPGDGRFIIGSRVTATPSGYHYEYAVQNLNSHRGAASFAVPIPAGAVVTDVGFHDVDYHSGEPSSGSDWSVTVSGDAITWTTEPYATDPNANALRWGTLYNFRFDSPVPPVSNHATLGLFRPGIPGEIAIDAVVPCHGGDLDADAHLSACDCDDGNEQVWATPGEVSGLVVSRDAMSATLLSWSPSTNPGATAVTYDVIRSPDPSDFVDAATCLTAEDPSSLTRVDPDDPPPGSVFSYVVRARNACPEGTGPLGETSNGDQRPFGSCP